MSVEGKQCRAERPPAGIARYIPLVAAAGAAGLAVSIWLLSGYATPLLHLLEDFLK